MTIKLEVGKRYLARDGRVAAVVANSPYGYVIKIGDVETFKDENGLTRPSRITFSRKEAESDLIWEITSDPDDHIGLLQEKFDYATCKLDDCPADIEAAREELRVAKENLAAAILERGSHV